MMNLQIDEDKLYDICQSNDILYLGLFGSHSVGDQHKDSDVDLLVDFAKTKSLFEKGRVLIAFQDLFQKEVDLISKKNIKPNFKPYINSQLITLYKKN